MIGNNKINDNATPYLYTSVFILLVTLIFILITNGLVTYYIHNKIKGSLPDHMDIQYQNLRFDLLGCNLTTKDLYLSIKDAAGNIHSQLDIENVTIKNISLIKLLSDGDFIIEELEISVPNIYYNKSAEPIDKKSKISSVQKSSQQKFNIAIESCSIVNGKALIVDDEYGRPDLQFDLEKLKISAFKYSSKSNSEFIPFTYESILLTAHNLTKSAGKYEDVDIKEINYINDSLHVKDFKYKTIYEKENYNTIINDNKTHYNISAPLVIIDKPHLDKINDTLVLGGALVQIKSANAIFFKDKTIDSPSSPSELYNEKIRKAKAYIGFDKITIKDSHIGYQEKSKEGKRGEIKFEKIYASLYNMGNTYSTPSQLDIKTQFMGQTPTEVSWSFDTRDISDAFSFDAKVGLTEGALLDTFMRPMSNISVDGQLRSAIIDIDADRDAAICNMDIEYKGLKIKMLKDNNKVKTILTKIANWIIVSDDHKLRKSTATKTTDRDPTWSQWSYIWQSIFTSLKSCIT